MQIHDGDQAFTADPMDDVPVCVGSGSKAADCGFSIDRYSKRP
ncbi:hypothetical protein SynMITS9220_03031 [Synechococcus sp. MIT S9220]|nr:hypothetical protein SynMITS9220_03031 [Synechococcus sp. MIT S9220]